MKTATKRKATAPTRVRRTSKAPARATVIPFPFKPQLKVGSHTFTEKHTGLEWTVSADFYANLAAAEAAAKACRIGGHADWRVPQRHELETLIDTNVHNPATWPELRGITPTRDWYITSTPAAWNKASCVWVVGFSDGGGVGGYDRSFSGLCRFVRGGAAGPGQ